MNQLDMFADQIRLYEPVKKKGVIRELHTQYLMRVEKFWSVIHDDHREASRIMIELGSIACKLYHLGKYEVYNLKYSYAVTDHRGQETKRGMQQIIYAENKKEALEFLSMHEWVSRKSAHQDCRVRYTKPQFIQVPAHLRKDNA